MKLDRYPKSVFLTGATGVLGARLLKDLLQSTPANIFCLARGETDAHATARVQAFLKIYDRNDQLAQDFLERVTVFKGDVALPALGLDENAYSTLQSKVDLTIHAAANTSLLLKYKRLEPINVQGTKRVIDFCLGTAKKRLSYVSTYTVMGDKTFDRNVSFQETDYDLGQGFEHLNYQRSKFHAEALVRSASGLNWRIFRPGQIYGDSQTGDYPFYEAQTTGLFYDLFKTAIETKVMPESYIHYDVVPVDYVSRAIVALSAGDDHFFDVFHLVNPDAKSFADVMSLLRDLGYEIDLLPEEDYKRKLRAGEITKNGERYSSTMLKAFSLWYFISKISFYDSAKTECHATTHKLEPLGIRCAPLDSKLIATYVNAGIREGYFPHPNQEALV